MKLLTPTFHYFSCLQQCFVSFLIRQWIFFFKKGFMYFGWRFLYYLFRKKLKFCKDLKALTTWIFVDCSWRDFDFLSQKNTMQNAPSLVTCKRKFIVMRSQLSIKKGKTQEKLKKREISKRMDCLCSKKKWIQNTIWFLTTTL